MSCEEILFQLRRYLPEDIGIYSCRNVSERFHARLNAKTKTYIYRVWNSTEPCVFERKFVQIDSRPLTIEAMQYAAKSFLGEHDFSAFCANKNKKKSTVRFIRAVKISRHGEEIQISFTGNGFIHNQVRIMVGTLIEVGRGERTADSIAALFGGKRCDAGFLAPAQGLCLMRVIY
jgi:tRNA pseudouridine38-40 synthase